MQQVREWLKTCDGVTIIAERTFKIGMSTYWGIEYKQSRHGVETHAIYTLGSLPACYQKRKSTLFLDVQSQYWYIAGYMQKRIEEPYRQFHPFGGHFLLMPAADWQLDNRYLDNYKTVGMARV